jgi:hypothetical protein
MKRALLFITIAIAGCGSSKANNEPDAQSSSDAVISPDAPIGCTTSVSFQPADPVAGLGAIVVATGSVQNATNFVTPTFVVTHNAAQVTTTKDDQEGFVVHFDIPDPGPYHVHFDVGDPLCAGYETDLNVKAAGANTATYRLRVVPPPTAGAPPYEHFVTISGGADYDDGTSKLDPGLDVVGSVIDSSSAPVAAYLRFEPDATPDVTIESFSSAGGAYDVRVQSGKHDVLIVPASDSIAPYRINGWTSSASQIVLPDADTISGVVVDSAGSGIAGARVAVAIAGTPTTIATTDASGNWSVLGHAGGTVDVTVVPPDASGLPRLEAKGAAIDVAAPITIKYAALATVDLAGVNVQAAGVAAPGARVIFTGQLANAGTVSVPTKSVVANGVISTTVVADGSGVLGPQKIVKAQMSAVVEPSPAVDAVVAIDTNATINTIDAPAMIAVTGIVHDPSGNARANVRVRLTPIGALAAATLFVPAATTDANGAFSILGAPGGHYALAARDLAQEFTSTSVADVTTGDAGTLTLGKAIAISGVLQVMGSANPVVSATVTLLCGTCTGVDRSRALGEAVTDIQGNFRLAVPDPGIQQ